MSDSDMEGLSENVLDSSESYSESGDYIEEAVPPDHSDRDSK